MSRPSLLLVTDLLYEARGRRYGDEDAWLSGRLREHYDTALASLPDAVGLLERFDVVVVRNCGPVIRDLDAYRRFRERLTASGTPVFNDLGGRGDMLGKQYLVDLTHAGEPVVPTVDRHDDLPLLGRPDRYVVKPLVGADSIGFEVVEQPPAELAGLIVQPHVEMAYEVSFVFVDRRFHYALRTGSGRWQLEPYEPAPEDLAFARRFVEWNGIRHGVQRVDACRTADGALLLVELEDLNPYLSLDVLPAEVRDRFVEDVLRSVGEVLRRE